jgi:hypothetical protein
VVEDDVCAAGRDIEACRLVPHLFAARNSQRRIAEHQFPLDRGSSVIVCDDGRLESSVIVDIFDLDDGFSGQSVSEGVFPRPAFAVFSGRTGISEPIAR